MTVDAEIFVIGAGPAGLTTAYCLTKETPLVIVIEKDPVYLGGISRTVRHGIFFSISAAIASSRRQRKSSISGTEILPTTSSPGRRLIAHLLWRKVLFDYPLSAFQALRNLGIFDQHRLHAVLCVCKGLPRRSPRSFHDWVRNRFG